MDLPALKAELTADPASIGYVGQSDAAVVSLMTSNTRAMPIQSVDVRRYLLVSDRWPEIVRVARFGDANADKTRAAIRITEALDGLSEFDMTVPAYVAAITGGLDALVSASLISADDKAAVLALGDGKRSRCDEMAWPAVSAADVAAARALS